MSSELEVIGLALQTDGVERGIRSLDELAARGPKVEKSLKGVEDAATQAGKGVGSLGASNSKGLDDIAKSGDRAAQGLGKVNQAAQSAVSSQQALAQAVASFTSAERGYVQSLMDEYRQLSQNRGERAAYIAQSKGMSASAQEVAKAVGQKIDAYKREQAELAKGQSAMEQAKRLAVGVFSGLTVTATLAKLVSVQREFDVLNSSLKTVAGGSAAAERELAWLKDFAKETPFGLAQATQGFVKMKALGLDPTRASLTSFGNTASAMGKGLNQMIEAVADASTGEFERLKEFGIKAKKEGNNVALTFQGVTTTVKNNSDAIVGYLEKIGNTQFGGAMAERAKTLDGAISELGDTWDELFRTINSQNAGMLIYDGVKLANGAIEDATTIIRAMTEASAESASASGAMATVQSGIATVFETAAVLGANLSYVLKGIGTEIGGLAAQVAQAAQFNFAGVGAIRAQMVSDAEAARKEIDATEKRILGARKAQEEYAKWASRNASAGTDPRRLDITPRRKGSSNNDDDKKGLSDALAAQIEAYKSADQKILDNRKDFYAQLSLQTKLGNVSELDEIEQSLAKENEIWAQRSANFAKELAAVGKKTNSLAEQQRVTGQIQAAERDHQQVLAKLAADSAIADAKASDALEARISLQMGAAGAAKEQVRAAQLEGQAIGLTGDALREFNQAQVEEKARRLESLAVAKGGADISGRLRQAYLDEAAAVRKLAKAQGENRAAQMVNDYTKGIEESNTLLQAELGLMGMSQQAREIALEQLRIQLDLEKKIAFVKANVSDPKKQTEDIAALEAAAAIAKANASSKIFLSEWQNSVKQYDDIFRQGFADMLNKGEDGWKSFTKSLATTFKTTVADALYKSFAQPFVVKIVGQLLGLTGGSSGAAGAAGGGGGLGGIGSTISNIASILGSGGMGAFGAGFSSAIGEAALGASFVGPSATLAGGMTGFGAAAGSFASSVGSFAAAAGPWVLAAAAIYGLVKKFDTSGTPHVGSMAQYSEAGGLNTSQTHGAFGMGFGGVDYNESAATLVSGVSRTVVGILDSVSRSFGGKGGFTVSTGFADDSSEDGAWGGLLIEQFGQALVNWDTSRTGKWAPRVFADGEAGQREYLAALAQDVTGVLREMDLPGWAQDTLTALGNSPSLESLATAIDQINSTKAALDTMGKNLVGFAGYSDAAASALIKASGGISALAANASAYYENFYTEAERQANATRDVTAALAAVNIALPASRDAYRALVEQYTAMGTAGASTLAVLLGLSGAFAAITPAADAAAAAIGETLAEAITRLRNPERSVEDIARNTISLEDRLAQVQNAGNTAALRERELRGLTAAEAALQRRIWLLEDEARVTSERDGLELQYLQLMGDTAAIRARERAALDESNRALYDRINAINDERAAAQAVSDMLGKANISAASMADIIRDGMLGRMSQEDVGAKLTEMIVGGINNALASRFADQISTLFIDSIITPMLTAVTTGGSISTAVSQSSIDAVIASATAAAANMAAIFNDPSWQAAMDAINTAIRGVSGAVARPASPAASADNSSWMAANEASYQAAQDAKKAWQGVGDTILDEVKRIRGEMVGGTAQSMSNAQAQFAIATAQARSGDQEAAKSLPGLSQALLTIAEAQASSTLELRRIQAATAASLELTNSEIAKKFGLQVPSYDVGTNYVPQDMLAMVHEGEAIVPRAFNPALAGGTSSNSNADLVAEVRALRAQVALLQAPTESIERNTKRTAQDLDDVTRNGMPVINQPDTELATA